MELLDQLQQVGYALTAEEGKVKCHWQGPGQPDPAQVRPLLDRLRKHKGKALTVLREESEGASLPTSVPEPVNVFTRRIPPKVEIGLLCFSNFSNVTSAERPGSFFQVGHITQMSSQGLS